MALESVQAGYRETLASFGITKEGAMPGWLASKAKGAGGFLKNLLIGDPKRFAKEVREGKVWEPGSTIRSMFEFPKYDPKKPIWSRLGQGAHGLFLVGLPAYEGYNILTDPEGHKAERIGGMLGGTALGWAAMGPAGILGSIPGGMLGEYAGSLAGKGVGKVVGETNPAPPTYAPAYSGRQITPARIREYLGDRPLARAREWDQERAGYFQGVSPGHIPRRGMDFIPMR